MEEHHSLPIFEIGIETDFTHQRIAMLHVMDGFQTKNYLNKAST